MLSTSDLLISADHAALVGYREKLAMLTIRGIKVQHTPTGFIIPDADTNSTVTVTYPDYEQLPHALNRSKAALQSALQDCSVLEHIALTTGSKQDYTALVTSLTKANRALAEYHSLVTYDRIRNGALIESASQSLRESIQEAQDAHTAALVAAQAATTDAKREPMLKNAIDARARHAGLVGDKRAGVAHRSMSDVVITKQPIILEESDARRKKRLDTIKRNSIIEKKEIVKDRLVHHRPSKRA
jgi:hypothetical protein